MLTLYLTNNRPSFTPHPGADVATIATPAGCELLTTCGEPMLFVPAEPRIRHAWFARDVWLAARSDDRGFHVASRPMSPEQARRAAIAERHRKADMERREKAKARRAERLTAMRAMRRDGLTLREIGRKFGLSAGHVHTILNGRRTAETASV